MGGGPAQGYGRGVKGGGYGRRVKGGVLQAGPSPFLRCSVWGWLPLGGQEAPHLVRSTSSRAESRQTVKVGYERRLSLRASLRACPYTNHPGAPYLGTSSSDLPEKQYK